MVGGDAGNIPVMASAVESAVDARAIPAEAWTILTAAVGGGCREDSHRGVSGGVSGGRRGNSRGGVGDSHDGGWGGLGEDSHGGVSGGVSGGC